MNRLWLHAALILRILATQKLIHYLTWVVKSLVAFWSPLVDRLLFTRTSSKFLGHCLRWRSIFLNDHLLIDKTPANLSSVTWWPRIWMAELWLVVNTSLLLGPNRSSRHFVSHAILVIDCNIFLRCCYRTHLILLMAHVCQESFYMHFEGRGLNVALDWWISESDLIPVCIL